jgi:hypothetical protein
MIQPAGPGGYDTKAFDRGTYPVLQIISIEHAKQLVQYKGDAAIRSRIDELAAKSNEGELSPEERAEYEGYVHANKFVAVLQAQARKFLASSDQQG